MEEVEPGIGTYSDGPPAWESKAQLPFVLSVLQFPKGELHGRQTRLEQMVEDGFLLSRIVPVVFDFAGWAPIVGACCGQLATGTVRDNAFATQVLHDSREHQSAERVTYVPVVVGQSLGWATVPE